MRTLMATVVGLLVLVSSALAESPAAAPLDWRPWRGLPVQDGGRQKPLDSLAWETLRLIANRTSFTDPASGQKLDATGVYVSLLLDWPGWDAPPSPHATAADSRTEYFRTYPPDAWDRTPLILVDFLALRTALGMAADEKYISPWQLSQAEVLDPDTQAKTPWNELVQKLADRSEADAAQLTTFQQKLMEVASRLWTYQDLRSERSLAIVPLPDNPRQQWATVTMLLRHEFNDQTDPSGGLRKVKAALLKVRSAYREHSPDAFAAASTALFTTLAEVGPKTGTYPSQATIDLEVAYNHWVPFRFAWVLSLVACLAVLVSMGSHWRPFYYTALVSFAGSLAAMFLGFGMRVAISGRAPVTDMYESVIYVGLGVAVFGMLFELIYRRQFVLAAAAAVATITLILADNCPALLNPNLRPLQPVLRNNFWLVTHVMSITLSYAAFALAVGIANITLGYYLLRSKDRAAIDALSNFTYRTLQIGVFLLAVGTILGGVWADYSWGRFWGWDPKEVFALVALLVYLAVLHARYVGWVANLGLAACSVACFLTVIMAWYGVNFLLGTGLHSYGFSGNGGQLYVGGALLLQLIYVGLALLRAEQPAAATAAQRTTADQQAASDLPRGDRQVPIGHRAPGARRSQPSLDAAPETTLQLDARDAD